MVNPPPITNQKPTKILQELDLNHHLHPFTDQKELRSQKPRIIVRGKGVYIYDNDGTKYLDGMAGLWCVNIGYGRGELAIAAKKQTQTKINKQTLRFLINTRRSLIKTHLF